MHSFSRHFLSAYVPLLLLLPASSLGDTLAPPVTSCFFIDFDTDDDPWTTETIAAGTSADFRWVFECPPVPPNGEEFDLYLDPSCCEFDFGNTRIGAWIDPDDPGFDPQFIPEWQYNPPVGIGCEGFPFWGRFASDAPFVPGERYFVGAGRMVGRCGPQDGCTPSGSWIDVLFVPYFNSTCEPTPTRATLDCISPPGACCLPDGSCEIQTEDDCPVSGGRYQGPDTQCEPGLCPPTGACCFDDATCAALTEFGCSDQSGAYTGDGVGCDPSPCPPGSACCFADGSCLFLTEIACGEQGGTFRAPGESCDPSPCDPGGACCFVGASCQLLTASLCSQQSGDWEGAGTSCTPYPCPAVQIEADGSGDVATIQAGLDFVTDGAVIELGSGIYTGSGNVEVNFRGKAVTLRSRAQDADSVTIDCENQARGLDMRSYEGPETRVEDITVVRGFTTGAGAGLRCINASPTVVRCRFLDCRATDGGAVFADVEVPTFIDCVFAGNRGMNEGGAFYLRSGAHLTGCTVVANSADDEGGGLRLRYSDTEVTLERTVLWGNCVDGSPDDLSAASGVSILANCAIVDSGSVDLSLFSGQLLFDDPALCLPLTCNIQVGDGFTGAIAANSPCLPGGNECGVTIGAGEVECADVTFGACCFVDATCRWLTEVSCTERDGRFFADTPCDPSPCDPIEACCFPDIHCELLPGAFCLDAGGEPFPGVTSCDPTPCGLLTVYPDGSGQFPNIQAAVNTAVPGETVLLADGVFSGVGNRLVSLLGKAITLRSASGNPENCIIDCRVDSTVALWALTITSGEGSDTRVEDIAFRLGHSNTGGAIRVLNSSPTLDGCVFESCTSPKGGAIYFDNSASSITDCRFEGNSGDRGGAIYALDSSLAMDSCVFVDGSAAVHGGALVVDGDRNGTATGIGNCTFYANSSPEGAAIATVGSGTLDIANSIVAFGLGGVPVSCESGSSANASCTDVYGNSGGDWVGCLSGQETGSDNFSLDPLFCGPELGDLSIRADSPCSEEESPCGSLVGAVPPGCDDPAAFDPAPEVVPDAVFLSAPHPNPSVGSTTIRFGLPDAEAIEVRITDVSGRTVAVPIRGRLGAGVHTLDWNGRTDSGKEAPRGVYYVVLRAGSNQLEQKLVWLR